MDEGTLDDDTRAWVQKVADDHFDGDFGRAAAVILEAARARYLQPEDRWAELDALMRGRGGPR